MVKGSNERGIKEGGRREREGRKERMRNEVEMGN